MTKISRNEARQKNLKKFFTGKPCSQGHVAGRYVSSGTCEVCARSYSKGELTDRVMVSFYIRPTQVEMLQALVAAMAMEVGDPIPDVTASRFSTARREAILNLQRTVDNHT